MSETTQPGSSGNFMDRLKASLAAGGETKEAEIGRYVFFGSLVLYLLTSYCLEMPRHKLDAQRAEMESIQKGLDGPKPFMGGPVKPDEPPAVPGHLEGDAKTEAEKANEAAKKSYDEMTKKYDEAAKSAGPDQYKADLERWEWEQENAADLKEERDELAWDMAGLEQDAASTVWEHRFRFLAILGMTLGLGVLLVRGKDWERLVALFVLGFLFPQLMR